MGKLPPEIWMLFVFWRLLCYCFLMVVLPFPLCLRIFTSLVPCWQSQQSVKFTLQQCAACSLLQTNNASMHCWWRGAPGKGAGAGSWYNNRAGSFCCLTLLLRHLKDSLPFVRFQKSLSWERDKTLVCSAGVPGHIAAVSSRRHILEHSPLPAQSQDPGSILL